MLAVLLGLALAAPVAAQSTSDERDDLRDQQAEAEGRLDVLQADYRQLEDAVADYDRRVREQEAAKRSAEQRLEVAEEEVAVAEARVTEAQGEIDDLRDEARQVAVDAYVSPVDETTVIAAAEDFNQASRRHALLGSVTTSQTDLLDDLRANEEDLVEADGAARDARRRVDEERQEVERRLARYREDLAEQRRLRDALQARIDEVNQEVEALAAEEAALTAAIRRQQAAAAQQQQQQQQAPSDAGGSSGGGSSGGGGGGAPPPPSGGQLQWPTSGPVTSPFGPRWGRLHAGIDIGAPTGQPIVAAESGSVFSGCGGGYGNCVLIDHGNGMVTLYAHMTSIYVGSGQGVSRGQTIGTVGCTGSCTGPHLHFETRVNGVAQNPLNYL